MKVGCVLPIVAADLSLADMFTVATQAQLRCRTQAGNRWPGASNNDLFQVC